MLALTLMLRPSDIAPHAILFSDNYSSNELQFNCNQLQFEKDGSLTIWLHGVKNDSSRDGFQVNIPPSSNIKVDPICALRVYLNRTKDIRPKSNPVFIALKSPYNAIKASTVSKDLETVIEMAGLSGQGYSAKSFRPTGATTAIQRGCNPDNVRAIGRWKCREVFENHYVYPKVATRFTDTILGI